MSDTTYVAHNRISRCNPKQTSNSSLETNIKFFKLSRYGSQGDIYSIVDSG